MRVVLYARVSTNPDKQEVGNQLIPMRKYAAALDYEIIKEYVDYASGGNSNRPQFQEMLEAARRHEFDIILIWALDRFSREGILNTLFYLKQLRASKVALFSLHDNWLDTRDEGLGQLLLAVFSWIADQERKRISERVKAGLKGKENVGKRGKDKKKRRRRMLKSPPLKNGFFYK